MLLNCPASRPGRARRVLELRVNAFSKTVARSAHLARLGGGVAVVSAEAGVGKGQGVGGDQDDVGTSGDASGLGMGGGSGAEVLQVDLEVGTGAVFVNAVVDDFSNEGAARRVVGGAVVACVEVNGAVVVVIEAFFEGSVPGAGDGRLADKELAAVFPAQGHVRRGQAQDKAQDGECREQGAGCPRLFMKEKSGGDCGAKSDKGAEDEMPGQQGHGFWFEDPGCSNRKEYDCWEGCEDSGGLKDAVLEEFFER